jgi:cytidylate kinase
MPVITISASYGAGGSWVGPQVAERLGWRFIDRAIPVEVAERLAIPLERAIAHDETAAPAPARLGILLASASAVKLPDPTDATFCRETERLINQAADTGDVVLLGRAGALVLRDRPGALHVRLDGPEEARVRQAMRLERIDHDEARRRLGDSDRSRMAYVKYFYRRDPREPRHYHLMLDSTALPLETCVELILTAARGRSPG